MERHKKQRPNFNVINRHSENTCLIFKMINMELNFIFLLHYYLKETRIWACAEMKSFFLKCLHGKIYIVKKLYPGINKLKFLECFRKPFNRVIFVANWPMFSWDQSPPNWRKWSRFTQLLDSNTGTETVAILVTNWYHYVQQRLWKKQTTTKSLRPKNNYL